MDINQILTFVAEPKYSIYSTKGKEFDVIIYCIIRFHNFE